MNSARPIHTTYEQRISVDQFGFDEVHVPVTSSTGDSVVRRVRIGMPKIPAAVLKNVLYLYESEEAAKKGIRSGGTGFLVGVPSAVRPNALYIYAITNYHNINGEAPGWPVVRLNKLDGTAAIYPFGHDDWTYSSELGYDIAATILPIKNNVHDFKVMPASGLMSREKHAENRIGPGDETFMVGRFVDHDGSTTNVPSARFGYVSINPTKMMSPYFQKPVEMYCLDTNSRSGYSGSPVYVYRTMTSDLERLQDPEIVGKIPILGAPMLMLLGIHCGQFPEWYPSEIRSEESLTDIEKESMRYISKAQVKGVSGMTVVAPAWAILDLLNTEKLKRPRDAADAILRQLQGSLPESEVAPGVQLPAGK